MNGLLIGRFQPFHLGHIEALRFALSQVDNLWIGIGSSNKPTEKNNPFTADERKEMILSSIDNSISSRIQIYYIPDFGVLFTNDELTQSLYSKRGKKISSVPFRERETLSGTNIREKIISDQNWHDLVPEGTKTVLQKIGAKNRLKIL